MSEELSKEIMQLLEEVIQKLDDAPENTDLSKKSVSETTHMLVYIKNRMRSSKFNINRQKKVVTYNPIISDENNSIQKDKELQIGSYKLNITTRMLTRFDESIKLTRKEMQLLAYLCVNKNVMVYRNHCLAVVWKNYNYKTTRSMDVYMCRIRKFLKDDPSINILNIHGVGYKLMA